MNAHIEWFDALSAKDVATVGGKNASLGELVRSLKNVGVQVPDGFATTSEAYWTFLDANKIRAVIEDVVAEFKKGVVSLQEAGERIRRIILDGRFPDALAHEITDAYHELSRKSGVSEIAVAVRSSATAEDLPNASFAGQQESFLNVRGDRALLDACRRCYASLFTDRAISYREAQGFDHLAIALSIGIQVMVRSDKAGSGVMFSIDTDTGFPDVAVISAAWGLGENIVQGAVNPDKYAVFKPLLRGSDHAPIIEKTLGAKEKKMVYAEGGSHRTVNLTTTRSEREQFVLSDPEILTLARWALAIEQHYGRPMDMEWAKDGETNQLMIVQARPETVQSRKRVQQMLTYRIKEKGPVLTTGVAIGQAVSTGEVCLLRSAKDIAQFRPGAILVTETTDPDWVPVMKLAAGIITDHGGATSHAAIVSRELGVPAIVGTSDATQKVENGRAITLSCAEGDVGYVYDGRLHFETAEVDLANLPRTRTQMMINVATPATAFQWWRLPAKGVGLARMEFIISNIIRVHPMALAHPERVSAEDRKRIQDLTRGYESGADYFVQQLARGVAKIGAAFHPHPVIVRLSDFKTNEYAQLVGGASFEPAEENPMLGFRGASRYYHPRYQDGFLLECRALRKVRDEIGLTNIIVMVPFCRTLDEADHVLESMAQAGLRRGENALQVYMMCEIPANVILAEQFATRFDGFSIGSNDLTQLILGIDRDSSDLAPLFDERNEAVTIAIKDAISKAHRAGIKIGICGQAPSNYPEFAAMLVKAGIDSISLNPDSFAETLPMIAEVERELAATGL